MDTSSKRAVFVLLTTTLTVMVVTVLSFLLFQVEVESWVNRTINAANSHWIASVLIASFLALDVFLPIPSSVLSASGGALLGPAWGTLVAWIGLTLSCIIGYGVGAGLGATITDKNYDANILKKSQKLVDTYGYWGLVITRPIPVLAETTAILSGVSKMSFRHFFTATSLSNIGVAFVYAVAGSYLPSTAFIFILFAGMSVPLVLWLISRIFNK